MPVYDMMLLPGVTFYFKKDIFQQMGNQDAKAGDDVLFLMQRTDKDRKDLTPNVCAVYTEKEYRCKGIAGRLLCMAVEDLRANGISPVYLLTDHVGFYEHYGCSYVWFKATEKLRCRECTCISNLRQLVCNVSDWRT